VLAELIESRPAVARGEGLEPLGLQAELEHPNDLRFVVHDEHAGLHGRLHAGFEGRQVYPLPESAGLPFFEDRSK
jgi:hypothetical protein